MGTRSSIGIEQADGKIKAVYCHYDGYPSHNGKILLEHYNSYDKANAIVKLGDLSVLDKSIEKPPGHTFNNPVDGHSIFYKRDRGEQGVMARIYQNVRHIFEMLDADYAYVFKKKENAWYYAKHNDKELKPLTDEVIKNDYENGGAIKGDRKFNYTIGGL